MRLAVSNIAWAAEEDDEVHALLIDEGVNAIEIAPTRIWKEPGDVDRTEARGVVDRLAGDGLAPVSFQSLLFARPELTLFDAPEVREELHGYLARIVRLAAVMGAGRLVFGSPKSRTVPEGMSTQEAFDIASAFFASLGGLAEDEGTVLCIEPNPPAYACNFVTTGAEGADLVAAVGSPGFGLHLDAAGLVLAGDDPAEAARAAGPLVRHVHASAPYLGELEQEVVDHSAFATALQDVAYDGVVSIEMRPGQVGSNAARVRAAVRLARAAYEGRHDGQAPTSA